MGQISTDGRAAFRDFNTDGVPATGAFEPEKAGIRALFDLIDSIIFGYLDVDSAAVIDQLAALSSQVGYRSARADNHGAAAYRSAREAAPVLVDLLGNILLGVTPDGMPIARDIVMAARSRVRSVGPASFALTDRTGRQLILGVNARGEVMLSASEETRASIYQSPDRLRGSLNLRSSASDLPGRVIAGQVQEADGTVTLVRQRRDSPLQTAVCDAPGPMEIGIYMGQSNAGSGSAEYPPAIDSALYPHHVLTFGAGGYWYGTDNIPIHGLRDLQPMADNWGSPYGNGPATLTAFARECFARDQALVSPGQILGTSWYGGQMIATFQQGTISYNNSLAMASAAVREAGRYGRSAEIVSATFIQGESVAVYGGGTPAETTSGYAADLNALLDDWLADLKSETGQTRDVIAVLAQINSPQGAAAASGVELAQRNVAIARADTVLAGPMYAYPLRDEGTDDIHLTNIGRLMFGEVLATAHQSVRDTGSWQPLDIASVTRSGAVLTVTFTPPTGMSDLELSIDADWVMPTANLGFSGTRVSDGAAVTIDDIVVSGWTATITLSANPGGQVRLRYGLSVDAVDQWAACRGQIMVQSGIVSPFWRMGLNVPEFVRHYCVRTEAVSAS